VAGPAVDPRTDPAWWATGLESWLGSALEGVLGEQSRPCAVLPLELVLRSGEPTPPRGQGRAEARARSERVRVTLDEAGAIQVTRRQGRAGPAELVLEVEVLDLPELIEDPRALAVGYMQGRVRLEGRTGAVLGLLSWWARPPGAQLRKALAERWLTGQGSAGQT